MRLLQPLSDIYFGSLHICLKVLQAGSTTKYRVPLICATSTGPQAATPSREFVLFLSNRQNQQFLVNNTIENLHCINKVPECVPLQQLDAFRKYKVDRLTNRAGHWIFLDGRAFGEPLRICFAARYPNRVSGGANITTYADVTGRHSCTRKNSGWP